jgi:hypothetical protein
VECVKYWQAINSLTSSLNWYDLYRPVYSDPALKSVERTYGETIINGEVKKYRRGFTMDEYTPWLKGVAAPHPSLGDGMTDYANLPEVKEAMNIPSFVEQAW